MKIKIKVLLVTLFMSAASYADHPNVKLAESLIDNLAKIEDGLDPYLADLHQFNQALQQNLWVNFGSGSFPSVWNRVICSNSKLR